MPSKHSFIFGMRVENSFLEVLKSFEKWIDISQKRLVSQNEIGK